MASTSSSSSSTPPAPPDPKSSDPKAPENTPPLPGGMASDVFLAAANDIVGYVLGAPERAMSAGISMDVMKGQLVGEVANKIKAAIPPATKVVG